MTDLRVGLVTQGLHSVPSVESGPNLLVSVDETLELGVEFDVLAGEDVAVVLKSVNFRAHVGILSLHGLRGETKLVLFTTVRGQVVVSSATLGLQVIEVGRKVSVAGQLTFRAANKLGLLGHLEVEGTGQLAGLVSVAGLFITGPHEIGGSRLVGFCCSAELELTSISLLCELSGMFLGLVKVVISGLNATILVSVLSRLHSVEVLGTLDLFLVTLALLLKLGQFVTGVVVLFTESVATVTLLGDITLAGEDFSLTAGDLFASRSDLSAQVVVRPVLFIEQETGVIDLLLEAVDSHNIGVVTRLEVIVLEKFLILQVSVLGLDGIKLVTESKVVLISLLNLEDLSLKLGNE